MADWQHEEQKKDYKGKNKVERNQNKHQQKRTSSCKGGEKGKETRHSTDKLKRLKNYKTVCFCDIVYMFKCPILWKTSCTSEFKWKKKKVKFNYNNDY